MGAEDDDEVLSWFASFSLDPSLVVVLQLSAHLQVNTCTMKDPYSPSTTKMILQHRTRRHRFALFLVGVLSTNRQKGGLLLVSSLTPERSNKAAKQHQSTPRALSSNLWAARHYRRPSYPDEGDPNHLMDGHTQSSSSARISGERPTLTLTEAPGPSLIPDKPKIVVLGATGKIGRLVIRQLLESSLDATIVACCRDYDKACRVLYDDLLVLASQQRTNPYGHERIRRPTGPNLQIVPVDLVPPEELPGYESQALDEEAEWLRRATSAAKYYKNSVQDYDNRHSTPVEDDTTGATEALEEAIKGCTAIISCVGAVRPTNLWTDFLARPLLRLLKHDVSDWCQDPRHPFYVHYCSTRKVLALAEREQLRREAAAAELAATPEENERYKPTTPDGTESDPPALAVPRIRFIRISDLCVAEPPWALIPWVTNVFQSMVFRYQDMTEQILRSSPVLETVILRPGDLVDDLRDESTTSLQVGIDGKVPTPARVGREDVAALAVAATLFDSVDNQPFHYTFAVRWAGQQLHPFPAQGCKSHGLPTAQLSLQAALRQVRKRDKVTRRTRLRREKKSHSQTSVQSVVRFARKLPSVPRRLKPYGLCVAVPVYLMMAMAARTLVQTSLPFLPGIVRQVFTGLAAFVVSGLTLLMQGQLPPLLARLPLRKAAQKYISF